MRILLVTEDLPVAKPGGAGLHAVALGNALIEAGHYVELVGLQPEDGYTGNSGFAGAVHRLIDFRGARWREDSTGAFLPMVRPHTARRLLRAINQVPGTWDVVHYHGHNPHLGELVPDGMNFVHTLHDQGAECITKIRFRDGQPCAAKLTSECAGCAAPSPNLAQQWLSTLSVNRLRRASVAAYRRHQAIFVSEFLSQRYCQGAQVAPGTFNSHVVHNFVDMNKIQAALAAPRPVASAGGRLRVFAAGRIDSAKGFHAFLDAISDAQLAEWQVTIAGDGPGFAAARAAHEHRGVRFMGWQPPGEVLTQVRAAQLCVVPSLVEEACATTVMESLALGRTVLALRRGGTPELAIYGQPGQLQLFDSLADLVAALANAPTCDWPVSGLAGVSTRLAAIEGIYRAGMTGALQPVLQGIST